MPKFNYVAMDAHGKETKGTLEVSSQNEAIGRVKEMGLFPTKIVEIEKIREKADKKAKPTGKAAGKKKGGGVNINIKIPGLGGRVKSKVLTTFTRQLATLVDAGLPLLRGLRVALRFSPIFGQGAARRRLKPGLRLFVLAFGFVCRCSQIAAFELGDRVRRLLRKIFFNTSFVYFIS